MAKRMTPKRRVMKKKPSPARVAKKPASVEELDDHAAATMGDTPIP